jgi:hypothetical protein
MISRASLYPVLSPPRHGTGKVQPPTRRLGARQHLRSCGDWALADADPLLAVSPTDCPQADEPKNAMYSVP